MILARWPMAWQVCSCVPGDKHATKTRLLTTSPAWEEEDAGSFYPTYNKHNGLWEVSCYVSGKRYYMAN